MNNITKKRTKRFVKKILSVFYARNEAYVKKCIDEADVVSFDLFDTLICRRCKEPENVFYGLSKNTVVSELYKNEKDFVIERVTAEMRCRKENGEKEITLNQIYDHMERLNSLDKSNLITFEKQCEEENAITQNSGKTLYEYAISQGKEIVITSDMYLPIDLIQSILKKNDYTRIKHIFLSSEVGETKASGRLYEVLMNEFKDKKIIHIGDDVLSDCIKAQRNHIKAVIIR